MSPDGQERRKNNTDLDVAVLGQKLSDFMEKTKEYRISLCAKIEDLGKKMECLPCKERKGWMDNINVQLAGLWACTSIVIFSIVGMWVKGK